MDGEPSTKKQRTNKLEDLWETTGKIRSLVDGINRLYHKRKLKGLVRKANYDADEAAFYTFRDGDEIGIFELFRTQTEHAEYCLTKWKEDKGCQDTKGFGQSKFIDRIAALDASITSLKADLAADKYEDVRFFTVHLLCTENFKEHCGDKYFHLSPRVETLLNSVAINQSSPGTKVSRENKSTPMSRRRKKP